MAGSRAFEILQLLAEVLGKETAYKAAARFIQKKIKKFFDIDVAKVKFYTHDTAPEEVKSAAIKKYSTHPPAYVDPKTLSVVIDLDFYEKVSDIIDIIGHELGHLLAFHYQDKGVLDKKGLNYTAKYKLRGGTVIIHDPSGKDENLADMFSDFLSGKSLDAKQKRIMKQIGVQV